MSKESKTNKRASALTLARNMVRGAKHPGSVVPTALRLVPSSSVAKFVRWAERVQFGSRVPIPNPFPRSVKRILATRVPDSGEFADELYLLTSRLHLHRDKIACFLKERERFERAIAISDFKACEETLDRLESELGYSVWLIEMRLVVVAHAHGLEAQKRLASEIKTKIGRSRLTTIVHYSSERNEPSTVATRFAPRIRSLLDRSPLSDGARSHYLYHFLRIVPTDAENIQSLILHETTSSLIDVYEAFIAGIIASVASPDGSIPQVMDEALDAQSFLSDARVEKLRFLSGRNGDSTLRTRCLERDRDLLTGKHEPPKDYRSNDVTDFRSILIDATHSVCANDILEEPNTVLAEWTADVFVRY